MNILNILARIVLALGLVTSAAAHAGQACEEKQPNLQDISRGLSLAGKTYEALEASGQQVVILARAGQDLSKYGLRYSHLGFAYQQPDGRGGHSWRVLHKLNQCGTPNAAIYRQGLGEFFLDTPWRYEAAYVVPTPDMQAKLLKLLNNEPASLRMHVAPYSLVSYAWGTTYQQSNQWAVETLAMAMEPSVATREQAQAWLRVFNYQPSTLRLGPLTRLGARVTKANVAFDDHPSEKRFADRIETVTVDSVFSWMGNAGFSGRPVVLR